MTERHGIQKTAEHTAQQEDADKPENTVKTIEHPRLPFPDRNAELIRGFRRPPHWIASEAGIVHPEMHFESVG
jgi:hypothetical protein